MLEGRGYQAEGEKGKNYDNYNNIINKIYLKIKKILLGTQFIWSMDLQTEKPSWMKKMILEM